MSSSASSTPRPPPRPVTPSDHPQLLALNNEYATELSYMTPESFAGLLSSSWLSWTLGDDNTSLLVTFDENSAYDNPNFQWHKRKFDRFVYVDRVVSAVQGRGDAKRLYTELAIRAREHGHTRLVCEINVDPPNPVSKGFHNRLGFREVGRAKLENGKTVAYFECPLMYDGQWRFSQAGKE